MLVDWLPKAWSCLKVFLSFSDDYRSLAEEIAHAVRNAGHTVFLDQDTLPPASDYNQRIRKAISSADLLVFLASRRSLSTGQYTQTELDFARERWPAPLGKVFPILVDPDVQPKDLPLYLRSIQSIRIRGSAAAEVAVLVDKNRRLNSIGKAQLIAALLLAMSASTLAAVYFGGFATVEPLSITVKDNPAAIGAFSDQPIYGVIPSEVSTTGSPGHGCTGFRDWLKLNSGVDAGETKLQMIVQGRSAGPLLISEMRIKILRKMPLVKGIPVSCPPAGEAKYRPIEIDLDADPPRVRYEFGKKTFGFTVQAGETEAFNIVAKAANGHYSWVIELDLVADGNQRTIEISGPAGPFETTARQWSTNWEWDYQGSWSAAPNPSRADVLETIPVGRPLPTLK